MTQLALNLTLDPLDPKNHGKPLWVVYGHECMPSLMCCKLRATAADYSTLPIGETGTAVVIWGYSVWEGVPGFRTLGSDLSKWAAHSSYGPLFFASQEPALDELRRVTTPEVGAR